MLPIEQSCFWLATRSTAPSRRLDRDCRCDVAIVGGGLTGLWTALFLTELSPSTEVAIVEAESVAYGASGRNAGMLSETIDYTHALAIQHFGFQEAGRLAILGQRNVVEMVAWLARKEIPCDLELTGRLMVALTEGQLSECANTVATAERLHSGQPADHHGRRHILSGCGLPGPCLPSPCFWRFVRRRSSGPSDRRFRQKG